MQQNQLSLKIIPIAAATALFLGCVSNGRYSPLPPPRALGAAYTTETAISQTTTNAPVPERLRLPDALALSLQQNPELVMFSQDIRMAESRVVQAGLPSNPELGLEIGEYNRGGEGFDSSETAVTLGQLFELGGKRHWRRRIAEAEGELVGWDYESTRLDVFAETSSRFSAVLIAEERLSLTQAGVELATKVHQAVSQRVSAGKESPLESSKSGASLTMATLDAQEAENSLTIARRKLAAMWGAQQVDFDAIQGELQKTMLAIPSLEVFHSQLTNNPALARWDAQMKLDQATLAAEKSARVPDVETSVTYLQYEEDDTDALAFGVSLPLPLFDRNQGAIATATHSQSKALAARRAAEIELVTELAEVHAVLTLSNQKVISLLEDVVPAMEKVFEAARDRYLQGKSGVLDMLDAQRGLFEAKVNLLDAQARYQTALIDVQRLTVTDIETLIDKEEE